MEEMQITFLSFFYFQLNPSEQLDSEEKSQRECQKVTADHNEELPRVRGLFTKLSASVDQYQAEKEAYLTELKNIVEEIQDVESSLDETKPTLARYDRIGAVTLVTFKGFGGIFLIQAFRPLDVRIL